MTKRKIHQASKSKAIQNALGQLGWHASGKDVVAFLANFGIDVDEGLVHKVKVASLKDTGRVRRQLAQATSSDLRRMARLPQKIPTRRPYRR